MDTEKKNYYEVLEVPLGASPQEIDQAYSRAKNAYSGDSLALYSLMSADECKQILQQIEEAYSILGFPEKRREYDRVRGFNTHSARQNPFEDFASPVSPSVFSPTHTSQQTASTPETKANFHYDDFGSNIQEAKVSKVQALKKFSLDYAVDAAMEQKIEQATDYSGALLKEIRQYKNVSAERMIEMIRISRSQLEAIEGDIVTKLPADVYTRGFVSQYAKVLKLNPELVATSYVHHIKRIKGTK